MVAHDSTSLDAKVENLNVNVSNVDIGSGDAERYSGDKATVRRTASSVIYRPMTESDLDAIVREFDRTWGQCSSAAGTPVSMMISRHFVLHYLQPATRGEIAERNGQFLGVTLSRVVRQPVLFPQAGKELADIDDKLNQSELGRKTLRETNQWHALERRMEDEIGINDTTQAEVELFLVSAEARGHGVGGTLWNHAMEYFARQGVSQYYLHTDSSCDVSFYEHKGLACVAQRYAADHPEDDADMDDIFIYEGALGDVHAEHHTASIRPAADREAADSEVLPDEATDPGHDAGEPSAAQTHDQTRNRHESPYVTLFRIPGAKAFCISGAAARLPISMMSLGIVLALNHLYDNWTVAGSMSAAYILAVAAVTPFYAKMFDRLGQHRVGPVALAVQVVVMLSFAFAALVRVPIPVLFVLAMAMGATQFSFGALVRTRWAYVLRNTGNGSLLNTAYATEAAIDEVVFILGPILAAFLATSVHPVSQLFVPTAACGIGGAVFFSLRDTVPVVPKTVEVASVSGVEHASAVTADGSATSHRFSLRRLRRDTGVAESRNVLTYPGIIPLLVVFVVFNMSFTAFDVSMTATMKAAGVERLLGLQLAMFAVGSCCGAVIFGSRQMPGSHWRHMVVFLSLLTVGFVLFRVTMDNFLLLGVMEVLAGLCVSPLFATGNLIVKDIVPAQSLTEGLSWVTTAGAVGTSFGSTLAGAVLDTAGSHTSMMIPWLSTLCAVPLALIGWQLARRR